MKLLQIFFLVLYGSALAAKDRFYSEEFGAYIEAPETIINQIMDSEVSMSAIISNTGSTVLFRSSRSDDCFNGKCLTHIFRVLNGKILSYSLSTPTTSENMLGRSEPDGVIDTTCTILFEQACSVYQ